MNHTTARERPMLAPVRTKSPIIEIASEILLQECGKFLCDVLYSSNDAEFLRQRFAELSPDAKRLVSLGSSELFRLTHPQELYVSGEWRCDRCEFCLHKRTINRGDGSVGTDRNPLPEICPNHCVMHPERSAVRAGIEDIPLCVECAERFTNEVETALNPHEAPFYKTIVEGRDATIMRPLTWKEADKENTASILYAQELVHQAINRIDSLEAAWPSEYSMPAELLENWRDQAVQPIPMVLHCPACWTQHIDMPESQAEYEARMLARQSDPNPENYDGVLDRWTNPPHRSHRCSNCKTIFRPAPVHTVGVVSIEHGKNDTWRPGDE